MADNTTLNPGSGGDIISSDDIAGVKVQRVKIQYGIDGVATDVNDTTPLPVDDAGGSLTVDVGTALPAGTNAIGKLAANSGVDIGDVDVTSLVPGTGATNLGKAVDAAAGATDTGVPALAVRDDALTTLTPVDGDYVPLRVNSTGALHVTGGGGGTEYAVDDALGATPTGGVVLAARDDALSALTPVEGDAVPLRTDANGALWVKNSGTVTVDGSAVTQPVSAASLPLPSGASTAAKQPALGTAGTPSADVISVQGVASMTALKVDGSAVTQPVSGTVTANAGTGTFASGGVAAHDAAISGNPVRIAGRALSASYTAVATGDTADLITDLNGKLVVLPYCIPENRVSGNTSDITTTTSTSVVAAAGAGLKNYITHILIQNSHATVGTWVLIQDGSAGTTLYQAYACAAGGGASITLPVPIPTTANTALFCACVTTGANVRVSASGYKAA